MITTHTASRVLVVLGLIAMVIGAIDPLEGCVVILAGVILAALGAFLCKAYHRKLLYWSTALVATGVAAMIVLSNFGGIGGSHGHSWWWGFLVLPYPIGWMLGLTGASLNLVEFRRLRSLPEHGLQ